MKFRAQHIALVTGLSLSATAPAYAHIKVSYPTDRWVTDGEGDPQKKGPCGGEMLAGKPAVATKVRTQFKPGQKIEVAFIETIYHPGFFRVSFDDDGDDAFKDPKTVADIQATPMLPILADGLAKDHNKKGSYKFEVTLPNVKCKTCTLQIIQFMSENAGTVYHHCQDIELTDTPTDGGAAPAGDAGAPKADMGAAVDVRPVVINTGSGGSTGTGGASVSTGSGGSVTGAGGASGSGGAVSAPTTPTGSGGSAAPKGGMGGMATTEAPAPPAKKADSGGCAVSGSAPEAGWALGALALLGLALRKRLS